MVVINSVLVFREGFYEHVVLASLLFNAVMLGFKLMGVKRLWDLRSRGKLVARLKDAEARVNEEKKRVAEMEQQRNDEKQRADREKLRADEAERQRRLKCATGRAT